MTKTQIEQSFEAFGNVKLNAHKDEEDGQGTVMTTSGIGLGISTSFKLAQAMNGDLKIES